MYIKQELSSGEISKIFGIDGGKVRYKLAKFNIPRRSISEGTKLAITHGLRDEHGEKNPNWKNGVKQINGYIYLLIPSHQHAMPSCGYVAEHILVWEQFHNKKLPKGWVVHHLNGVKNDNSPQNLLALPNSKHNILIKEFQKRIRQLEIENKQLVSVVNCSGTTLQFSEN